MHFKFQEMDEKTIGGDGIGYFFGFIGEFEMSCYYQTQTVSSEMDYFLWNRQTPKYAQQFFTPTPMYIDFYQDADFTARIEPKGLSTGVRVYFEVTKGDTRHTDTYPAKFYLVNCTISNEKNSNVNRASLANLEILSYLFRATTLSKTVVSPLWRKCVDTMKDRTSGIFTESATSHFNSTDIMDDQISCLNAVQLRYPNTDFMIRRVR